MRSDAFKVHAGIVEDRRLPTRLLYNQDKNDIRLSCSSVCRLTICRILSRCLYWVVKYCTVSATKKCSSAMGFLSFI